MNPKSIFFVSYTAKDRAWAEWIAWVLEEAGYPTRIQAWDFRPGSDWVAEMTKALDTCERVIAVLSPDYLVSKFGTAEWRQAFQKDPLGEARALVPVRIAECDPGTFLNTRVYTDLVGFEEPVAQERLLQAVADVRVKPSKRPPFPARKPVFPTQPKSRPELEPSRAAQRTGLQQGVLEHVQRMIQVHRDPDLLLHTFYGLAPEPYRDCAPSFETVYYLWADAEGSSISVNIEFADPPGQGPRHFCIRFRNARGTYPSNVAFRPGATRGLDNSSAKQPHRPSKRFLSFEARLAAPQPAPIHCPECGHRLEGRRTRPAARDEPLAVIAMGYRMIDRLGTHWELQAGNRIERVASENWMPFNIDLANKAWSVFNPDGNYRYANSEPDFSMIVAVVIEFGSDNGEKQRPGDGHGILHLRNFRLRNSRLRVVEAPAARHGV